ncbi:hypothetical protein [Kitasatospora sp. NPDC094015]|uniref:hypothetical protein n=1 Tax=Kitasatospora sp. NPDC094015 TaxID=3155205 RepID=UPI00333095D3
MQEIAVLRQTIQDDHEVGRVRAAVDTQGAEGVDASLGAGGDQAGKGESAAARSLLSASAVMLLASRRMMTARSG